MTSVLKILIILKPLLLIAFKFTESIEKSLEFCEEDGFYPYPVFMVYVSAHYLSYVIMCKKFKLQDKPLEHLAFDSFLR